MPDLTGAVEDSDWEFIGDGARALHARIAEFADVARQTVRGAQVSLPAGCISRQKEKWRPLKRVAMAAGGRWPYIADRLIRRGLAEDAAENEAGLRHLPPGMILLTDLHAAWPKDKDFMPTRDLVDLLRRRNPDYWGADSPYGKPLTDTRLGRLVAQASKITSQRIGGRGPRGYSRALLEPAWRYLGITRCPSDRCTRRTRRTRRRYRRVNRLNRVHRPDKHPSGYDRRRRRRCAMTGIRTTCQECGAPLKPRNITGLCTACKLIARNERLSGQRSDTAEPVSHADAIQNVTAILGGRPVTAKGDQE
jgi:hypothetical protein